MTKNKQSRSYILAAVGFCLSASLPSSLAPEMPKAMQHGLIAEPFVISGLP